MPKYRGMPGLGSRSRWVGKQVLGREDRAFSRVWVTLGRCISSLLIHRHNISNLVDNMGADYVFTDINSV